MFWHILHHNMFSISFQNDFSILHAKFYLPATNETNSLQVTYCFNLNIQATFYKSIYRSTYFLLSVSSTEQSIECSCECCRLAIQFGQTYVEYQLDSQGVAFGKTQRNFIVYVGHGVTFSIHVVCKQNLSTLVGKIGTKLEQGGCYTLFGSCVLLNIHISTIQHSVT